MMDPTYTLSKEEKKFLACFYTGHVELLQPTYKGWVSLYSYLDNTHESMEQQKKFNKNEDVIISTSLRIIGSDIDNKTKLIREVGKLKAFQLSTSEIFLKKFITAAKWFWYKESDTYINQSNKKSQIVLNKITKDNYQIFIEDKKFISNNEYRAENKKSKINFRINKKENISKHHKNNIFKYKLNADELTQTVKQAIENKKNYITLDAFDLLKKISNDLQNQKKDLLKKHKINVRNYSYEISQIEAEIAAIANALPFYEVIDPSINHGYDCVRFGAIVILKNSFELLKIKIVGSVEIKFKYELEKESLESWDIQYLNWSSPRGANLIGKQVGDSVKIDLASDLLEIIEVIYPKPLR